MALERWPHRLTLARWVAFLAMVMGVLGAGPVPTEPVGSSIVLQGVAYNVTANASTGFTATLTVASDGTVSATGDFDDINLFGAFAVSGVSIVCDGQCFQLTGDFIVGGADGSGFPEGTRANFTLSLAITGTTVRGVYHIDVMPGITMPQYGILEGSLSR
jgi:hypothetical protein